MRKIKEILRLRAAGFSARQIAAAVGAPKSTIADYLKRIEHADLSAQVGETELERMLFPAVRPPEVSSRLPDYRHIHCELKKKGVTLALLWEEYLSENEDGYRYTQFDRVQKALRSYGRPRKNGQTTISVLGSCFLWGARLRDAELHTKRSGRVYVYYRCTHKSKTQVCNQRRFLREERLAAQVSEIWQNASLPAAWRDRFLARIDAWQTEDSDAAAVGAQNLKTELEQLNIRIDRLLDVYLDGALEETEFKRKKNALMDTKARIEQPIDDFKRQGDNRLPPKI